MPENRGRISSSQQQKENKRRYNWKNQKEKTEGENKIQRTDIKQKQIPEISK